MKITELVPHNVHQMAREIKELKHEVKELKRTCEILEEWIHELRGEVFFSPSPSPENDEPD